MVVPWRKSMIKLQLTATTWGGDVGFPQWPTTTLGVKEWHCETEMVELVEWRRNTMRNRVIAQCPCETTKW